MRRAIASLLAVGFMIGCAPPPPGTAGSGSANNQAAATQGSYPVPEAPAPTIADADRPKTVDELVGEFLRRYQNNMYEPFVELAYWGASTDAQKKEYLASVRSTFISLSQREVATISGPSDIEIIDVAKYDAAYYPKEGEELVQVQPQPTHIIGITGHFGESVSVTNYFAVGVHDGKYYFCTIKHD